MSASASPTVCVGTQPVRSLPGPRAEAGPPDSTPLYRVPAYVDRTATARHSAVSTGLSVDDGDQAADVYRIPSKEAEPVLSQTFGRKHLRVEHVEQAQLYG